jgi:hypothetical protein
MRLSHLSLVKARFVMPSRNPEYAGKRSNLGTGLHGRVTPGAAVVQVSARWEWGGVRVEGEVRASQRHHRRPLRCPRRRRSKTFKRSVKTGMHLRDLRSLFRVVPNRRVQGLPPLSGPASLDAISSFY